MIKTLYKQIGEYWKASLLTPVWTALEVVMDVLIPYVTASLIDKGINAGSMENVYLYGAVMIGMAFLSLGFGILAGRSVAYAATGFAANLRRAMYRNIQRFAFSDIDKYSTSGLVTRMTTDVSSLQNAYQQILRITVRAPFRLVLSIVMCLVIDARLSFIFIIAMVILSFSLYNIISRVARLFQQVFVKYDELNQSVQENIQAIRVVKAFVREDYENKKFSKAAEGLYKLYVRAESLMALNHPVMNIVVYGCIIALSWWGAQFVVGGTLTTGELTSLFTYVMSILQSLMMLSMIFVMLTQSAASAKRVSEVIEEQPDIVNPENPVESLSLEQLRGIYSGSITRWNELGAPGLGEILAYQRSEGSGSQTALERFVMGDTPLMPAETENVLDSMGGIVELVSSYKNHRNAIGYSFRFYCTGLMRDFDVKLLAVNGVAPTVENIENGSYPLASSFYAVTRADADENTLALLAWICGEQGQALVEKTGYTPLSAGS